MEPDAPQTFTAPIFNNPQHRERFQYLLETSEMQRVAIEELFQFSRHAYDVMHDLNTRVIQLEGGVDTSVNQNDRDITSRVTELDREFMSIGTQVTNFGHTVTNSNTLAALDSTPGEESAQRDLSNVMVNVQRFSSSAQASTHLVTRKASRHLMTDDVQAGRIAKTGVAKQSKKLKLEIPDNVNGLGVASPSNSASQTSPLSAFVPSAPASPITPYPNGRIGPPDAYRRTNTAINKRGIHNCDKSVPPADVQMPKIPLTDVEVIVFFFNSLSKPMVSLRLYGRNWGPAMIVQVLNDHRLIEPPYLRNTCSVKCTTALKNGRKKFGPDWEQDYRQVFTTADDAKATDLIRTEEENSVDYYVRALGTNLQSFPADESAGIFTRCVKYCIENNAPYTMSNVHLLALDLQNGMIPQHPASPAPGDVVTPTHLKSESSNGEEAEYYFGQDDVSPSADRMSYLHGVGALGGFKNLDAPQK